MCEKTHGRQVVRVVAVGSREVREVWHDAAKNAPWFEDRKAVAYRYPQVI
jgi:hypothetical protein